MTIVHTYFRSQRLFRVKNERENEKLYDEMNVAVYNLKWITEGNNY